MSGVEGMVSLLIGFGRWSLLWMVPPSFGPRRCPREAVTASSPPSCGCNKLTSFLSAVSSLAASSTPSLHAGAVPAAPTPAANNALMSAYSRAGHPGEVLRLFRSLPFPPTAPLFTTLNSSLADSGLHLAARAAFASLLVSGLLPTASACTALLKSHGAASPESVLDYIFVIMPAAGCSPDAAACNCIISMLCYYQHMKEAWGFLDYMTQLGIRPTVRSYTTILRSYCKHGRVLEAVRFFGYMIEQGCQPDAISYSVLIEGLCSVGEFDMVETMLVESEVKGWTPNAVTFNIYMSALRRMGRLDEAFRQFDKQCTCWNGEELGWDADLFCYNTLMSRLYDAGDCAGVLKMLVVLLKKGIEPDNISFTIAIRSLCRAGKLRVAKMLMDDKGIEYDVKAFNTLIHGFCRAGDLRSVILTYDDMISRNVFPNDFTNAMVIDSFCKDSEFDMAITFFLELHKDPRDGFVHAHLIRLNYWLVKAKRFGNLLNLLKKILSKGFVLDVCIFNSLITLCCCEGYCKHESVSTKMDKRTHPQLEQKSVLGYMNNKVQKDGNVDFGFLFHLQD
ncbi:hypothetical protein EJB05_30534, partial [Eragrostis curvula]